MSEFVEHVLEMMAELGPARAKSMFGGYGIYLDGVMFAIVADDTLYFKVDEQTKPQFEAAGLEQFVYVKKGKQVRMSFYTAPEHALEESDELATWARKGLDAALRAATTQRRKKAG